MNHAGLFCLIVMGAGLVLLSPTGWPTPAQLIPFLAAASLAVCATLRWVHSRFHITWLCAVLALCIGALVSAWQVSTALNYRVSEAMFGQDVIVTVRVHSVVDDLPRRQLMVADTLDAPAALNARRWRISWYGLPLDEKGQPLVVKVGDVWKFNVRIRAMHGAGNPGGFDVLAWYFRTHVDAVAYVRNSPSPLLVTAGSTSSINAWRTATAQRIQALSDDSAYASVVVALTLGIGSGVDVAFRELLVTTGTAHLLAISGLHIGLVFAAVFLLMKCLWQACSVRLGQRVSRTGFAGLVSIFAAMAYALIAGLGPSTLRAVAMCAVGFFFLWQRRSVSPWLPWSAALGFVVLTDVPRLLSPGVWLSFVTVALLIVLYQPKKNTSARRSFWVTASSAWYTHVALGICLLPITGWFFSTGSLIAPLANLLAVPVVSFVVVPLSLLVVLFIDVWPGAASVCLMWVIFVIGVLEHWLKLCAAIPFAGVSIIVPSLFALLTACCGVLCICAPRALGLARFSVPLCLPVLVWTMGQRAVDGLEVHVLDVGQGHASLVLTENHTVLVDTGGVIGDGRTYWQASINPALHHLGRQQLTHIIISHSDLDHAAAADELAMQFPDAQFWLGGLSVVDGVSANRCWAGERWRLDGVEFSFLHPAAHDVEPTLFGQNLDDNDESCVLLVQYGRSTVLFPGDIERRAEARLLSRIKLAEFAENRIDSATESAVQQPLALMQQVTVLVAPHHGSRTSSTQDWVDALLPEHVVFPAGHRNRSGFPHDDVLMRYKDGGSEPYVTGRDGALQFYFDPLGLRRPPTRYWLKNRRVWHLP